MLTNQEKELLKENLKKAIQKFNKKYASKGWYIKSTFKINVVITTFTEKKKDLTKIEKELKTMLKELVSDYQLVVKETEINYCGLHWQAYYLEF